MTLTRISVREVRSRSWKDGDVADDDYSTVTIHNSNNKFSSISRIFLRTSENLKRDCRPSSTDGHKLAKICSNPKTTKNVPRMSVNWSEIDPDGRRCGEYSLAIHSSMPVNHLRYHWCWLEESPSQNRTAFQQLLLFSPPVHNPSHHRRRGIKNVQELVLKPPYIRCPRWI